MSVGILQNYDFHLKMKLHVMRCNLQLHVLQLDIKAVTGIIQAF